MNQRGMHSVSRSNILLLIPAFKLRYIIEARGNLLILRKLLHADSSTIKPYVLSPVQKQERKKRENKFGAPIDRSTLLSRYFREKYVGNST